MSLFTMKSEHYIHKNKMCFLFCYFQKASPSSSFEHCDSPHLFYGTGLYILHLLITAGQSTTLTNKTDKLMLCSRVSKIRYCFRITGRISSYRASSLTAATNKHVHLVCPTTNRLRVNTFIHNLYNRCIIFLAYFPFLWKVVL